MLKTAKRFLIGGTLYYLAEVIWRMLVNHRAAHPIMIVIAGIIVSIIFYLDDKKVNIFINSIIGGSITTIFELVVGMISLMVFNERLWQYSGITYKGVISLKWSLFWILLCFLCILTKRFFNKKKNVLRSKILKKLHKRSKHIEITNTKECPDCKYFVGCERACGGVPCGRYMEEPK